MKAQKIRDSNMELLRIISMMLVLIYHANFLSLGIPNATDINYNALNSFCRFLIGTGTTCCVNIFILLSGWYKITPKINRMIEFLFQIFFFVSFSIIINIILWKHKITFDDIKNLFMLNNDILWFPKSYLLLYILSPILNTFASNVKKELFKKVLVGFFLFQTIYGWITGGVGWFNSGYSTISFIGLYLIARYLNIYRPHILFAATSKSILTLFFMLTLICSTIWYLAAYKEYDVAKWLNSYTSPFVILQGILLLLFFSKISFYNKKINWIATSCFAVYLLHCAPNMLKHYTSLIAEWYNKSSTEIFLLNTSILIITIFILSILIDNIRIVVWKFIMSIKRIK